MSNLPWFIGVMVILWLAWFFTGGPQAGRTDRPFLEPPPPVSSGETYGPEDIIPTRGIIQKRTGPAPEETEKEIPSQEENSEISIFGGKVSFTFKGKTGARISDPQKEYVEISASRNNDQPVQITGWVLKSAVTGKSIAIGDGAYLPYAGRVNSQERIFLKPGEEALITTGLSPIGTSFRLNICTGYFEQFQDFSPFLPKECPYAKDENIPPAVSDTCVDFIRQIPRCEAYIKALPLSLAGDPECQEFLSSYVNYNGCVELHRDDNNFHRPFWRIFLGRGNEFWKESRETILLLDATGKLVDSISY